MIILIHGDDITLSRNYFIDLKSKATETISLDGSKITLTDLTQALEGQDLFGNTKAIFIEELISKRKSSKELDQIQSSIINSQSSIVLWESKELTKKQLQPFTHVTIKQFAIPKTIFTLLDALRPNNGKQLVELFHKTLEDKDAEFVFFMLQRQVRILLAIRSHPGEATTSIGSQKDSITPFQNDITISEVSRLAPWQKGKLEKQAGMFPQQKLLELHSQLFDIEYGLKTGNLSMPLTDEIDLLLLSI